MQPIIVMHAANNSAMVHHSRHLRQVFRNLNSRNRGLDRIEFTAHSGWCRRFQVVRIQMARTAVIKHENARSNPPRAARSRYGLSPQQSRQTQRKSGGQATGKHPPATDMQGLRALDPIRAAAQFQWSAHVVRFQMNSTYRTVSNAPGGCTFGQRIMTLGSTGGNCGTQNLTVCQLLIMRKM